MKHAALYLAQTFTEDNIVISTIRAFRPQGQAPPSTTVFEGPLPLHSIPSIFIEHLLYVSPH